MNLNFCSRYVGMFYYTLTNIDPTLRSRLHAIMLLAVAKSQVINTYGINEILKPFVDEMMELESVCSSSYTTCILSYSYYINRMMAFHLI